MSRYEERVKNLEGFNNRKLHKDEKLGIAFDEQDRANFIALLKDGANPKIVQEMAKLMAGGRLSMSQCDLLKLIDKYSIKD